MTHPLDPGTPLHHTDGTGFSDAERQAFFENIEQAVRNSYKNARANFYSQQLNLGEQLDLLWHELNSAGTISKDGAWFNAVKAVKDAHPKDDSAYQKAVADVAAIRQRNEGV